MASTIQTRVISASNDNVISMSNSSWARGVTLPSNWSKVRLGFRLMTSPSATWTSGSTFAMGLCSGITNQVGDYVTTNFVGCGILLGAGIAPASNQLNSQFTTMTKVGTTTTFGSNLVHAFIPNAANTTADQEMFFVDITKGSPNYTIQQFAPSSNGNINASTSAQFFTQVIAATPVFTNHTYSGGVTIAASEAAGTFNAVTAWWSDTTVVMEINDLAVVLLA